eukprot:1222819-Pleurochrysis_carterae.AAC.1
MGLITPRASLTKPAPALRISDGSTRSTTGASRRSSSDASCASLKTAALCSWSCSLRVLPRDVLSVEPTAASTFTKGKGDPLSTPAADAASSCSRTRLRQKAAACADGPEHNRSGLRLPRSTRMLRDSSPQSWRTGRHSSAVSHSGCARASLRASGEPSHSYTAKAA